MQPEMAAEIEDKVLRVKTQVFVLGRFGVNFSLGQDCPASYSQIKGLTTPERRSMTCDVQPTCVSLKLQAKRFWLHNPNARRVGKPLMRVLVGGFLLP